MSRILVAIVLVALAGCSNLTAPKTFLQSDAKVSRDWLSQFVEIDLRSVPIADLPKRGAFEGLNLVLGDVDGNAVVSLEAPRVTRRQALWMLAEKYGLTMTVTTKPGHPVSILITNRETRRELKPLN